ncbi:MAG: AlpA family transcriptional regulator [Gemmatimonadetes bacterium]|nr:AlpA family transcriptional regulator [Gemmatimonadota bacterium]MYA63921.1 AlpA family transcriptional regulator [Gemmatimonadota bacterium]MYC00032.1 AlpA family transcriptional regulator [Gemmatimonadota bacterium]MYH51470.1 AlpA family transcriptional regulator [Gemmatimonadota bacterium]MYI45282.1 AlpA family transcriptional regulator [Gemmatimonadota bacterium]
MGTRVLRAREVVSEIGVSKATLYRWVRSGGFPKPIKLGPGAVGWRREELDEWVDSRPRRGTEGEGEAQCQLPPRS